MNPLLTYRGETKTLEEWSKIVGINKKAIWLRLKNHGWTVDEALEIKIKVANKRVSMWHRRIDRAVETVQKMMIRRETNKNHKQLSRLYSLVVS